MGAFSKEFWVTVTFAIPILLWTYLLIQSRGGSMAVLYFQLAVVVIGGTVIWRMGGRILEEVTRIWEKLDGTRVWDEPPNTAELANGSSPDDVNCLHCGERIHGFARFCRTCGKRQ